MFDIISFIREKIFRQPKLKPLAGEELTEKQTTKMGYFLLVCMFFAIISSAQWTIDIIQNIPTKPTDVPYCITSILNTFDPKWKDNDPTFYSNDNSYDRTYYYDSYDPCLLTSKNPRFDFTQEYNDLKSAYGTIGNTQDSNSKLQTEISSLEYARKNSQDDYNTSLLEKTAQTQGIYNGKSIQSDIKNNEQQIADIKTKIQE